MRVVGPHSYALILVICVGADGCGRISFTHLERGDAGAPGDGVLATTDVAGDGVPSVPPCSGTFGAPMLLPGSFNTTERDWAPAVTADGLALYHYSFRPGGSGPPDLWVSTRPAGGEFGPPELVQVSGPAADRFPRITSDQLVLVFSSERMGGAGMSDLWMATRATTSQMFGTPQVLTELNSASLDEALTLSGDGLHAVFASNRGTSFDLYRASRPDRLSPFGTPQPISELNTSSVERAPYLSVDGRTLYFTSNRSPNLGGDDLWMASRPAVDQPFDAAVHLAGLSSSGDDYAPSISGDDTTLYYSYDAPIIGNGGDPDVWIATRTCP